MTARDEHLSAIRQRWPEVDVASFDPIGGGWDCFTYRVGGWVFQFPRPGADEGLRKQIASLPELAREVSAAIPVPVYVADDIPCMGYRWIEGVPMSAETEGIWPERLGRFLYDLHLVPPEFVGMRAPSPAAVRDEHRREVADLADHVLPLLTAHERATAAALIDGFFDDDENFRFAVCLTHGDIGPEHVLVSDRGDLAGVIDWGDLQVGDPAWDLAWLVHAMPEHGARVLGAYGGPPDDRFLARCRFGFTMMPWHEVQHGRVSDQPAFVERGLDGVRARLG